MSHWTQTPALARSNLLLVLFCAVVVLHSCKGNVAVAAAANSLLLPPLPLLHGGLTRTARRLNQLGLPWIDNSGTWPAGFSDLDRAAETQRIVRAVVSERNKTAVAAADPAKAWTAWTLSYNVTFINASEAAYRRQIFEFNLAKAAQLNTLAGPDVAFGLTRFAVLTPEEFLAGYSGDAQNDADITIWPSNPVRAASPAASAIAALAAAAPTTPSNATGGSGGAAVAPAVTPPGRGGQAPAAGGSGGSLGPFSVSFAESGASGGSGSVPGRKLLERVVLAGRQALLTPSAWGRLMIRLAAQLRSRGQLTNAAAAGAGAAAATPNAQQLGRQFPVPLFDTADDPDRVHHSFGRQLSQIIETPDVLRTESAACAREVPFPYARLMPFRSVDWLRAGAVGPVKSQGYCAASYAYVAAALAESTMRLQGYNGSATDISEEHLMACFKAAGSCTTGGTVHTLLNALACNGVAATGRQFGAAPGAYPTDGRAGGAAAYGATCATGKYSPVRTGITGWAWVPANEFALAQALSRTPAKVSVDAALLQLYRAGYLPCAARSSVAGTALLAVGYNTRVRAAPAQPGSSAPFTYFNGSEYWMLRTSWGGLGSVDGYVYVTKGCVGGAPLGLMVNRGVIPIWNQTRAAEIGRLQCVAPGAGAVSVPSSSTCNADALLRLSAFCAGVPDLHPEPRDANCSCSCVPT